MRQLYSVKKDRFGITLRPAKKPALHPTRSSSRGCGGRCRRVSSPAAIASPSQQGPSSIRASRPDGRSDRRGCEANIGKNKKQAAELAAELPRATDRVRGHLRHRGHDRDGPRRRSSSRRRGSRANPFLLQEWRQTATGAQGLAASLARCTADVVNREILFAEGDDLRANRVGLGGSLRALGRGLEELARAGLWRNLWTQNAEAARGITETCGGLGATGKSSTNRPQGLVLSMGGVGWFQEEPSQIC